MCRYSLLVFPRIYIYAYSPIGTVATERKHSRLNKCSKRSKLSKRSKRSNRQRSSPQIRNLNLSSIRKSDSLRQSTRSTVSFCSKARSCRTSVTKSNSFVKNKLLNVGPCRTCSPKWQH